MQLIVAVDAGKFGKISQINRPRKLVNSFFRHLQRLYQEFLSLGIAFLQDLQPHRTAPLPLLNGFLNGLHQVGGLLVNIQIGIPGHPEGTGGLDLIKLKQLRKLLRDNILQQNKARPSAQGTSRKRFKIEGTCTTANMLSSLFCSRTAIFRLLFASRGNGRLVSTAKGVSTGNSTLSK